jgi:hypothetical protein
VQQVWPLVSLEFSFPGQCLLYSFDSFSPSLEC